MELLEPSQVNSKAELRRFAIQLLTKWVGLLDRDNIPLHLPRRQGLMRLIPKMPFHPRPELFLQISGCTTFEFPEETCRVGPGEICLVSRGLPHRERIRSWKGPFFNLVLAYAPHSIRFHLAHQDEDEMGRPSILVSNQIEGLEGGRLAEMLENVADWFHEGDRAHRLAVKSTLLANLSRVLIAIKQPPSDAHEPFKVMQMRQVVAQHLSNPELSVAWMGHSLQSSPDYLSRLFRKATGKSLGAHIIEQRMTWAKDLLESSSLNIAEISQAIGYTDPSYFTRIFRRGTGIAPRRYREQSLSRQTSASSWRGEAGKNRINRS